MIAEIADMLALVCIAVALYHYLGYPLGIISISELLATDFPLADREPSIALVIAEIMSMREA